MTPVSDGVGSMAEAVRWRRRSGGVGGPVAVSDGGGECAGEGGRARAAIARATANRHRTALASANRPRLRTRLR